MTIKDILDEGIYFNEKLAEEFGKQKSELLDFLVYDLTWTGLPKEEGSTEERLGVTFSEIEARNYILRCERDGWKWQQKDKDAALFRIYDLLKHFGLPQSKVPFEDYLKVGRLIIRELGFPHIQIPTEKIRAYMNISEDQTKTFDVDPYGLALGNIAERAMQEILRQNNKEFIARSFLVRNTFRDQEEKDITVYDRENQEMSLGVRCQREFTGVYLYSKYRVKNPTTSRKIANYIVFFNHFAHHIFYITGIVEKDFLLMGRDHDFFDEFSRSPMMEFYFPEFNYGIVKSRYMKHYGPEEPPEEKKKLLNDWFGKRLSFKQLLDVLQSYPRGL